MTINRQPLIGATRNAALAALAAGPIVYLVQVAVGSGHLAEALGGAVVGALFFASTSIVGILAPNADLKSALLNIYLFKTSLLVVLYLAVPWDQVDRPTAGIALVASSVAYLAVQTVMLSRPKNS